MLQESNSGLIVHNLLANTEVVVLAHQVYTRLCICNTTHGQPPVTCVDDQVLLDNNVATGVQHEPDQHMCSACIVRHSPCVTEVTAWLEPAWSCIHALLLQAVVR